MVIIVDGSTNQHHAEIQTFKVGDLLELAHLDKEVDCLGDIEGMDHIMVRSVPIPNNKDNCNLQNNPLAILSLRLFRTAISMFSLW
jgi:predicted TPR repeat methyltransferase